MSQALKKIEPVLLDPETTSGLHSVVAPQDIEANRIETLTSPLELDQPKEVLILFSVLFIVAISCLFSFFLY